MEKNTRPALDHDFTNWVSSLKSEIRSAQLKAATRVNTEDAIWQQAVAKLESDRVAPSVDKEDAIAQQAVAQLGELFFSVPWGHHIYIISHCKDMDKALFFLRKTVEDGWSRTVLLNYL